MVFQMDYPDQWNYSQEYNNIIDAENRYFFRDAENVENRINISTWNNDDQLGLLDYIFSTNSRLTVDDLEKVMIDGQDAYRRAYVIDHGNYIEHSDIIFTAYQDKVITITFAIDNDYYNTDKWMEMQGLYNRVLVSFKFID